jgi:hypothetical protein
MITVNKANKNKNKFSNLFKILPNGEMFITKITRPLSFWFVLLVFIILIILDGFGIKFDTLYINILQQLLITMVGFYFTARTAEKIFIKKKEI